MIKLDSDWMTSGVLDIEYKQYELLAYLQKVEGKFDNLELYPYFSDIMYHYRDLLTYKDNKQKYRENFPKNLIELSLEDTNLTYEDLVADGEYTQQLDILVDFSLVEFRKKISLGKFIFDEVKKCIDILEIGVIHFNNDCGFFIIHDDTIDVYEYEMSEILNIKSSKALRTKLVRSYPKGYYLSYESIRLDLIEGSTVINPSIFLVDSPIKYPIEETLLPITKRLLVKKLSQH